MGEMSPVAARSNAAPWTFGLREVPRPEKASSTHRLGALQFVRSTLQQRTPLTASIASARGGVARQVEVHATSEASGNPVEACPGFSIGPDETHPGVAKTNHCGGDAYHRVCMQLLDGEGKPLTWGSNENYWDITE